MVAPVGRNLTYGAKSPMLGARVRLSHEMLPSGSTIVDRQHNNSINDEDVVHDQPKMNASLDAVANR